MLSIYREFEAFIGHQKGKLRGSIALVVLESFFQLTKIIAVYLLLEAILSDTLDTKRIWLCVGVMAVGIICAIIIRAKSSMMQTEIGYDTAANKRLEIGEHLKYVPMGYFSKKSLGRITSIATNTCNNFQTVATMVMIQFAGGLANGLLVTLLLLQFNWRLGLVSMAAIVIFFISLGVIGRRSEQIAKQKAELDGKLSEKTLEYVQGMQVVKSFNVGDDTGSEYVRAVEEHRDLSFKIEFITIPILFVQVFLIRLLAVLIMLLSLTECFAGRIPVHETMVMLFAAFLLFNHLESAGAFAMMFKIMKASMDSINAIEETPVMDIDGRDRQPENYNIEFQDVDFSYDKRRVLKKVNLKIPEKRTTAIVGPSGSGKTTMINLIARFWDVDSGCITLGGDDVRKYKLDSLWTNISAVFQDVYLFNDTIENNIKFGRAEATREEVEAIAKRAHCHEFITALPNGYDTVIGEGGSSLSGGEAQRISIARAMMKDAPIIFFDEATANVDPENESLLQEAIRDLTKDKTVIMIAHRLKTVVHADQIVVMNEGRVEAVGRHEELLRKDGTYRDFIERREHVIGWRLASE